MVSEWNLINLGEVVKHQKGYAFKSKDYQDEGVLIARVSDFTSRSIDITSCRKIDALKSDEYEAFKLQHLDVVIATVGSWATNPNSVVGKVISVPFEASGALLNQNAVRLRSSENLEQRFLFYLLKTTTFQNYIVSNAQGSANQASITLNDIFRYEFRLPSLLEQKAIIHILGTLDDKIELNRQMNETLEAMAQALFKSWFVDFDPVIDNALLAGKAIPEPLKERAELRQAQLDSGKAKTNSEINDLFPSEFEFTEELGWIPRGWGNAILSDVLVRRNEKIKAGKETQELRYVPIDCITSKSLFLSESKDGEEAKTSLTKFYKKDIIFGAMRPYFHKVCIAPFDGTTRSTAFVLKPKFAFDYSFALMQLYQDSTIAIATSESVGSTIPYAKWDGSMADIPICMPSEELRQLFDSIVRASLYKIADRYFSNETLTKLRDTLLPKLMSGELRIPDAEKLVENI